MEHLGNLLLYQEIHEAILESDITDRDIILLSVHAQDSIANSVVVGVVGELSKDNTMKRFSQTFLLAPQATGFYVHNDFFRFLITNDDTEDNLVLMKDQRTSTEDDKISADLSGNMSSSVLSEKRSNTKKVIKKKSYASIITKASSLTIPRDTVEVFQKTDRKSSAPPKNADVLLRLEKDITIEASHEVLEKEKSRKSSSTDEIIDTEKGQGEKKSPPDSQDEVEQKKSYATILAKPRLPTKTESSSAARAKPSVASKNIGTPGSIIIIPAYYLDGYRYAFMQFNSQKAAQLAVEAGFIQFDE
ncbi:nuclear transport factor 2, partial [Tanacetum coccineum]